MSIKLHSEWFKEATPVWTDDAHEWGLRKFANYKITGIIHYCRDKEFGDFASRFPTWRDPRSHTDRNSDGHRCVECSKPASDAVVALHMLLHPEAYDKSV